MSQTVITQAFEALKAQEAANGGVLTLDEFVFASVPDLNITDPIDRTEGLPPAAQIVHRQAVSKTGMVNSNAVVYSVVLGADVGDFEFNWVGLLNKASGEVAMIVHAPSQKKIKTASGQQGNVLTRSFLMEYNGASQQTQIITPADTWQIDFTARLNGVDDRIRKENCDAYGRVSFLNDGFLVSGASGNYLVKKGVAYIEGLRAELLFDQKLNAAIWPSKIWVDVCWRGTLTSVWATESKLTIADTLENYVNGDEQHYVFAIAEIFVDGSVKDLRQTTPLAQLMGLSADPNTVPYFDQHSILKKSAISDFSRNLLAMSDAESVLDGLYLGTPGGAGFIGGLEKPITWHKFAGGANGDSLSNGLAIMSANDAGEAYSIPEGYWPNDIDATFNVYPNFRNYSGGYKLKKGLPGKGAQDPRPLIWAEKTSNMQRVEGGTKWFDVAMQGALTLDPTATAFGVGVSGYIRSSAGDVLTPGKSVDAIGVHGSGKAIGRNGRVWGLWGQVGNGDDGSGVRSSQLIGCELNVVNLFASQPHPENLPSGEGPYRGLIVTTADSGKACGIGIDVGDGSGLAIGESGWWIGMRLRRGGILPAGDWKNNYLEDTQQLKIEGALSNTKRYGGIKLGARADGLGANFTYGLNMLNASFQDANAINLALDHRIYWGAVAGVTKCVGYDNTIGSFDLHNMPLSINGTKVVGQRVTGVFGLTGVSDGSSKSTESMTLVELARYTKKIADALINHGMIGPI